MATDDQVYLLHFELVVISKSKLRLICLYNRKIVRTQFNPFSDDIRNGYLCSRLKDAKSVDVNFSFNLRLLEHCRNSTRAS